MNKEEYKHIIERYYSTPILKKLEINPESSDSPDLVHIDADGREIGIEVVECWCDDIKLHQMDDYTMSACREYKSRVEARGECNLWISVWFFDRVYKQLPNMSKKKFIDVVCEEIDRYRKDDTEFDYRFVSSISVYGAKIGFVEVSSVQSAFITTISEDRVIEYIKKKEYKIAEYRKKKLSAYWLFLTVPDRTFCGIDDLKMTQEVVSDYERIYICDSRHVLQVK